MVTVNIDYSKKFKYYSIELKFSSYGFPAEVQFQSGDFVKDWFKLVEFITGMELDKKEEIEYLSSVDVFLRNNEYLEVYLYVYKDGSKELTTEEFPECVVYYVEEDDYHITWEELQTRCK